MKDFAGKVAVVTGAASGIGRALADRFAAAGMQVVLADVERQALAEACEELAATGARVLPVPTDVSQAGSVEALARAALDTFGAVHVLCNNAGVATAGPTWEHTLADWQWLLGVNLWGVIHGVRTFVPIMLRQDTDCHVVNTASMAGLIAGPFMSMYNVAKFGVVALSETLHHELALQQAKVKVSVLCPGFVNTRIMDSERNRPAALVNATAVVPPEAEVMQQAARQLLAAGLPPARVAECVFEAIRDERLYVLTHPEMKPMIEGRMRDILAERNPGMVTFA